MNKYYRHKSASGIIIKVLSSAFSGYSTKYFKILNLHDNMTNIITREGLDKFYKPIKGSEAELLELLYS